MRKNVAALTLLLAALTTACQSTLSVEDAKQIPMTFSDVPVPPSPRTLPDIMAILEQPQWGDAQTAARKVAEASPPVAKPAALGEFYIARGLAAGRIGRAKQEIDDLAKASEYFQQTLSPVYWIYRSLAFAEERGGNFFRHIRYLRKSLEAAAHSSRTGSLISLETEVNARLAIAYASIGNLQEAEAALDDAARDFARIGYRSQSCREIFTYARAVLLDVTGRHAEAEAVGRKVVALLAADRERARSTGLDDVHAFLTHTLIRQGRLVEAESEAREAVLGALAKGGRYSPHTAWMLRSLAWVFLEQGRYREAETLSRVVIDIFERTETAPDSLRFATARADLASALELQGRDQESLGEYEAIRAGLSRDPESLDTFFSGNARYAELMLKSGRVDQALELLGVALERSKRLVGEAHRETAEIRGSLARAHAVKGDARRALHEFREASALLMRRLPDLDAESIGANRRLVDILNSFIGLLATVESSPHERETGIDTVAEAFRLADAARMSSVQRALSASAARSAARSPALAEVVRAQQDAKRKIRTLYGDLADVLSDPSLANARATKLRGQIEALRALVDSTTTRIEREFPSYAELIDPKPVAVDHARAMLRPGEALIATLVTQDRTFVWAVPQSGPVAFRSVTIAAEELERTVALLRGALEPRASILGDIPDFDLSEAHRLYSLLLEPVRSGWQHARSLLVVAHGPLGQLPPSVLPTEPATLSAESGALFSKYRAVPWLVRTHAVTVLPSVASLAMLRTLPAGDPTRRAFVGFGDPYFSREQAALADRESAMSAAAAQAQLAAAAENSLSGSVALDTRTVPVAFRRSRAAFDSTQLAKLPRLPDTAEEILSLAATMNADSTRDVFLGARANEKAVKTLDLASYRIIAFATHGLVPGDLEGLAQPALALSAPEVADVTGDGLLTLDEILDLRLDADWVVLSACNTASGQGEGSDAVSGFGRAFFYAGARALLVSNWPVETRSARDLTTDLFRRQQQNVGVSRAEALQQTINWLIDHGERVDARSGKIVFSYAHPIFWAPFTLVGDGSREATRP